MDRQEGNPLRIFAVTPISGIRPRDIRIAQRICGGGPQIRFIKIICGKLDEEFLPESDRHSRRAVEGAIAYPPDP